MVNLDSCVAELAEGFDAVVDKSLAQSEASHEERELLREKFRTAFKTNIELGLATVFAQTDSAKEHAPPQTEVTVDDLMLQEGALLRVVGRRNRYPAKAASLLGMTLKKNRTMLKGLKVNITREKVDLSGVTENHSEVLENCFVKVNSDLKCCKDLVVENMDKTSRLIESYKILKNTEEACLDNMES
eukprot:GFUD01119176.1.p1 GENE.GFUD01119176.1~~GFUD01119176.1.p1  ORF type:complete len:187 (+),score=42.33 GFUD01119176.1:38-598(+)